MFSKPRPNGPDPVSPGDSYPRAPVPRPPMPPSRPAAPPESRTPDTGRLAPSFISADMTVTGQVRTSGEIDIEGRVKGDIEAHRLTVGENAVIEGEITADNIIVNGHVAGKITGLKVRLAATARVEGDIFQQTIAIESGAHFDGGIHRRGDVPRIDAPAAPPGTDTAGPDADVDPDHLDEDAD